MPEPIALDEIPGTEGLFGTEAPDTDAGSEPNKVPCPECDKSFLPTGIKRHITMAHRGGVGEKSNKGGSRATIDLGTRWAQFQRGAALMVSFACVDCAAVLVEEAQKDGDAIALFCTKRPKLKKQLEQLLDASDILILVGTLGETAKNMAAHHSIGQRIGLDKVQAHEHANGMQGVAQFMQSMSEEDRQALFDGALAHMAANGAEPQPVPEAPGFADGL